MGDPSVLGYILDFTDLFMPSGLCAIVTIVFQAIEKTWFLVHQEFQVFNQRIPTVGIKPRGAENPMEYPDDHLLERIMLRKKVVRVKYPEVYQVGSRLIEKAFATLLDIYVFLVPRPSRFRKPPSQNVL
jgi:hypothetical protein